MSEHRIDITFLLTTKQSNQFRTEHGLREDEDLGPHLAHMVREILRQANPFFAEVEMLPGEEK